MNLHFRTSRILRLILAAGLVLSTPAIAAKGGKNGSKISPTPTSPTVLQQESYYFRNGGVDNCLGEDDDLEWLASGSLLPGESFSFTPQVPGCYAHSAAITVVASWDNGSLELSSTVPDIDYTSWDSGQAGRDISAPTVGNRAQLCMFPSFTSDEVGYTITLTNLSPETVHGIELHGRHENDWALFYYPRCLNADADGDGWNDSLEHTMAALLYPIGYIDGEYQPYKLWGSNYLRAASQSPHANDEIDSFPPDLNDDGLINADDLALVDEHLDTGNGIPLSQISPNPGPAWFHNNTLPFRRYDLDGDGWVTAMDRQIVSAYVDLELPTASDPVIPTARITSPANNAIVPRGQEVRITAHAWDNAALSRVDYLVNGKMICSQSNPVSSLGFESPLFSCWWNVPRRARNHLLEVRSYDASGNVGLSQTVMVQSQ